MSFRIYSFNLMLVLTIVACANEGTKNISDIEFFAITGAKNGSDIKPCADYGSKFNYLGKPYFLRLAETGRIITVHEGIDFCANGGADVISPAYGKIVSIENDNKFRGGNLTVQTTIAVEGVTGSNETLFVDALHITPRADLKIGDQVTAGEVIGKVQQGGKSEIGPKSHVHLSAGPYLQTFLYHVDPNRFWQKGAGIVTCFDSTNPPTDQQLVAPIRCK